MTKYDLYPRPPLPALEIYGPVARRREQLCLAWQETETSSPVQRYRFLKNLAARVRESSVWDIARETIANQVNVEALRVALVGPLEPSAMATALAQVENSSLSVTEALAIRVALTPEIIARIMASAADHIDRRAAQLKQQLEQQRDEVTAALAAFDEADP